MPEGKPGVRGSEYEPVAAGGRHLAAVSFKSTVTVTVNNLKFLSFRGVQVPKFKLLPEIYALHVEGKGLSCSISQFFRTNAKKNLH